MIAEQVGDTGLRGEDWDAVDTLVRETVEGAARVRRILPVGPRATSPYQVVVPRVKASNGRFELATNTVRKPVRIACEFLIRSDQIQDFDAVSQLARAAAQRVAAAEDLVLAFGRSLRGQDPPVKQFNVWKDAELKGKGLSKLEFAGVVPAYTGVDPTEAVRTGITILQTDGHTGPYVVLMLPKMWEEASKSGGGGTDQKKTLTTLVGEGGTFFLLPAPVFPTVPARNPANPPLDAAARDGIMKRGIVVAQTPGAFDLVIVDAPHVAMVSQKGGDLVMRVEERLVLRFMDQTSTVDISLR